jgi:hypothetical protein
MKILIAVVCLAVLFTALWFRKRAARISFTPKQQISVLATRPYYESWTVEWSYGWQPMPGGKTLWHSPTFRHLNMSLFITNVVTTNVQVIYKSSILTTNSTNWP